jgi:dimethylamine/trimethylamine dehydrogenase
MRDPRYDILFEPVSIGPVTTRNRFYQVPHCSGMGHRYPKADAHMRAIKAEGGWGVVSTQETEIHPSSDLTPSNQGRIWDSADVRVFRQATDLIHERGSLAAVQLVHNGLHTANRLSRIAPYAPSDAIIDGDDPVQARGMDKADIREFRRWHREAALRAREAGFDIVYVYAGHDMTLLMHFLLKRHNHRSDEYGGSLENRLRLFREVLADTRDAIGDRCALAVRFAVDELMGAAGIEGDGEGRDIVAALAEEPDLWDVNLSDWSNDSQSARFSQEGFQEDYTRFVKQVTTKPVVGVGRYTSPDTMVRVIRQGHLDLIGAARPSIADPFLPLKIEQGRIDEIRECIGCNICVASDNIVAPMRCTQNPTIGEEYRKGWHPERIPALADTQTVLVVGGGPAGLEAARALAQRGASVTLAEAGSEWGGRVALESRLPGLSAWGRVRDWRLGQLQTAPNVEMYLESPLTADDILSYGIGHVAIAVGSRWRVDGMGRTHRLPLSFLGNGKIASVDSLPESGAVAAGQGPVVVYDDDRYYMGSALAEQLAMAGLDTTYVTPAPLVAAWTVNTLEQARIHQRLLALGVKIRLLSALADRTADTLALRSVYGGAVEIIPCDTLVPVTSRLPVSELWTALQARREEWLDCGLTRVERIGDCLAPGTIAAATYAGHLFARNLGEVMETESADAYR